LEGWREQVSEFMARGLLLEHPSRRCALLLNTDGNQVEIESDQLAELLTWRLPAVDFQWWFTADVDVACQISNRPYGHETQTFYLDGLTLDQSELVESLLVDRIRHSGGVETLGLVVDRTGATAGSCDWDEILLGESGEIQDYPDLLVLPEMRFVDLGLAAAGRTIKHLEGGLVALGE
jgi:hypothetical protein